MQKHPFARRISAILLSLTLVAPVLAQKAHAGTLETIGVIGGLWAVLNERNVHYYKYASPAGPIEKKFTPMGSLKTDHKTFKAPKTTWKKYEVWYPKEDAASGKTYPLVIFANGTGTPVDKYGPVLKHLASWGFVAAGNADENCRTGESSAATLDFLLAQNENPESPLYGKIDTEHIGISGHSQGGVGAMNAVTKQPNGNRYKAIFSISATSSFWSKPGEVLGETWAYDPSQIRIPVFFAAGTGNWDAGTASDKSATSGQGISPLWSQIENFNAVPEGVPTVRARETGKDHGDMLRAPDAYMTAWFSYWLKGDEEAGKAFFGENPEIQNNKNWQDVEIAE